MTVRLYGTQGSGSAAIEMALAMAGMEYRLVEAASWQPSPGLDELRGVNPHDLWDLFADQFVAPLGTPWLGGDHLGAVDVLAATVSRWNGARAHLQTARPAFFELLTRVEAHPVVQPVWARHWPRS